MATKRTTKAEESKVNRKGFGAKKDISALKKKAEETPNAAEFASGSSTRKRLEFGNNLFWIMPPMKEETDFPWKSVGVHYNPFHVCMKDATVVAFDDKKGEYVKARDTDFRKCPRCQEAWDRYGYDKDVMSRDAWRNSPNYEKFKQNMPYDKIAMVTIPVDAFFTIERKQKGRSVVSVLELVENGEKLFSDFEKEYTALARSEDFKADDSEEGYPALDFSNGDKSYKTGIQIMMFSFDSFAFDKGNAVDQILAVLDENELPWGVNDDGQIGYILNIVKSGDKDDYTTIEYRYEVIKVPSECALVPSDDFFDLLGEIVPDISDILLPPSVEDLRKTVTESKKRSVGDLSEAPECFSDPEVYDPIGRDECFECKFKSKCGQFIREGKTLSKTDTFSDDLDDVIDDEEIPFDKSKKTGFARKDKEDGDIEDRIDTDEEDPLAEGFSSFDDDDDDDSNFDLEEELPD